MNRCFPAEIIFLEISKWVVGFVAIITPFIFLSFKISLNEFIIFILGNLLEINLVFLDHYHKHLLEQN